MALELRQQLKLTQQLIMTPQLQMAIKLLQLTRLELLSTINQELEENPTLEEEIHEAAVDEYLDEQTESKAADLPDTKEVTIEEKIRDDVDWSNYIDEYSSSGKVHSETEKKGVTEFRIVCGTQENFVRTSALAVAYDITHRGRREDWKHYCRQP